MGWTKRQFVEQAFEEIGLAAYVFDLTPEQLQSALRRLDAMMAGWNANGIRIGWPIPSTPDASDLDVDTKVADVANEAIYLNLALRTAPGFGKVLSPDTKADADAAYSNLLNQTAAPTPERQFPNTLPRGAGTKPWRSFNSNQFVKTPDDPLLAGEDNKLNFD
jgi:P22 tail accessory factor